MVIIYLQDVHCDSMSVEVQVHIHHSATTPNQVPWLRQDNPNFSSPAVSVTVAGTVSYAVTITHADFVIVLRRQPLRRPNS